MCGILGTIGFKNQRKLNIDLLNHRGPDGNGVWTSLESEYPAQFAHSRLAILDTSDKANQPMLSSDGRYVFVYNGEIYNFLELKSHLSKKEQVFHTDSDSEVLLKGLILEGPSFQLRCNGMWSFCLWDREEKVALFGRDRFGKKPLFYSFLTKNKIVFGSEMKAIYPFLNSFQFSEDIDIKLLNLFDHESSEDCVICGIKRIPAGHYAVYQNGVLSVKRWWNTLDHLVNVPKNYKDQVEEWRTIFLDAVKMRMRSDVRIGTALSGGLDSSATFCSMAHVADQNHNIDRVTKDWNHGFCSHYPGSSLDEVKWAELVTNHVGVELKKVNVDPLTAGWSIKSALHQVEDPYLTLPTPMLATYRAISKAGIKVTLDGHGADELFSGYGHLNASFDDASPKQLNEILSIIKSLESGHYEISQNWIVSKWLKYKILRFFECKLKQPVKNFKGLLSNKNLDFIKYKLSFSDQDHTRFKEFDSLTQSLYKIFHFTILPTLLRNYDRYSMASGVEIRMPFMDHRLVSYTFSLPWTSKVGGGYTKRILRDALSGIIPDAIRDRRDKIGWNAPLHEWFRGKLKDEIEDSFNQGIIPETLKSSWIKLQNHPNPSFFDGQKVWNLIMPYLWKSSFELK